MLCLDHEAFALPVHKETDPRILHRILAEGARRYPELAPLVPAQPGGAPADPAPATDPGRRELLAVLRDTRALLALPDNEFAWSGWEDGAAALAEVDALMRQIESGRRAPTLLVSVLFAPTGPLQETALSSGWGDEFLALARRCDAALLRLSSPPGE